MADFDVDQQLVRKLADLLKDTGLSEIEYESGDARIRVSRSSGMVAPGAAPLAAAVPAAEDRGPADGGHPGTIKSPMVGTVYLQSEPGSPPFVKEGDQVREGQTLVIIEAMKVMNPIPSPRAGTVTRVMVSDGAPVEFGEALLVID